MKFEKPNINFINIDFNDVISTSGYNGGSGSIEICNGPDAPMNNCSLTASFMV